MNRVGMGLAVGAGYLLGRTKKLKLAFAVGTLAAGRRMHLSPRAVADVVSQQLRANPQFKEIGDQLREDLRGVGRAASGAVIERRLDSLADRLHDRTARMRDQLAGAASEEADTGRDGAGEDAYDDDDVEDADAGPDDDREGPESPEGSDELEGRPERAREDGSSRARSGRRDAPGGREAPGKEPVRKAAKKAPAKKAPAKKAAAKKVPAKKAASEKAAVKRAAAKRTGAAKKTAGRAARGAGLPKGGGER
ncbi:DNA primase [Streptomyces sp. PRKS01-65]|nr:DNA primase [Streptomyces harenosi]NEY33850.1 DNA primase [Streptomyces harenosi]